jgi:alanyl-tRNA synthetase
MDIRKVYEELCKDHGIKFKMDSDVKSYDETTLFCPAGMQQFKKDFANEDVIKTTANIQSCIRLNDFDEVGDGTHCVCFDMVGLFSFRQWSLQKAVDFWMEYMKRLNLKIDYVTIHPNKKNCLDWVSLYDNYDVVIKIDPECAWSDGTSPQAYCTEFYIGDVEVGNIVNPRENCIDAGFGFERLDAIVNKIHQVDMTDKGTLLIKGIKKIIDSGIVPAAKKHGYVLRKLYTALIRRGTEIEESDSTFYKFYKDESDRYNKTKKRYDRMKDNPKFADKSKEFWIGTHGIDPSSFN